MARFWIVSIIVCLSWLALAGYLDKQREQYEFATCSACK